MAINNNAAYAQSSSITITGTCDAYPSERGSPDQREALFIVRGAQPNTLYYFTEIAESTGTEIINHGTDNFASEFMVTGDGIPGETYTLSWYQDFEGD